MKVLSLRCAQGHGFEGWFGSDKEFALQQSGGQVACPLCGDVSISKLLTAPRLNLSARRVQSPDATPAPIAPEARWMQAMRRIMAETEDVGDRFAEEARKIHNGASADRNIRGQASLEEAEALIEDGIAVTPLTLPPALKETLQ